MLRIRRAQKEKIFRIGISVLCVTAFMLAVFTVPAVARALPDTVCGFIAAGVMKTEYAAIMKSFTSRYVIPESYVECVPVSLSAVPGYDYEEETPPAIPDGVETVIEKDLCGYVEVPCLLLSNWTNYDVDIQGLDLSVLPFDFPQDDVLPAVLIIHTHGTESYLPDGINYYTPDTTFRSKDINENVVSVGKVIADALNSAGIFTIHDTTMYDAESYTSAYTNSRNAAKEWLKKYPSIKCIIDVHRDAIVDADGNNIKPVIRVNDTPSAQLMLVVGTDDAGANHPCWKTNLTFAALLQEKANTEYKGLMRPINLRKASFNQQLASGSFLLEVGSCANTITEARAAAQLFAQIFISAYNSK